jgi:hypothetical protein
LFGSENRLEVEMSSELGSVALERLEEEMHSEGWLGLERRAAKVATDSRGSAEPEPYERPVLA